MRKRKPRANTWNPWMSLCHMCPCSIQSAAGVTPWCGVCVNNGKTAQWLSNICVLLCLLNTPQAQRDNSLGLNAAPGVCSSSRDGVITVPTQVSLGWYWETQRTIEWKVSERGFMLNEHTFPNKSQLFHVIAFSSLGDWKEKGNTV